MLSAVTAGLRWVLIQVLLQVREKEGGLGVGGQVESRMQKGGNGLSGEVLGK